MYLAFPSNTIILLFTHSWRQWGNVRDISENFLSYRTLLLLSTVNDWETQTDTAALRYVEGYSDTPVNVHNQKISTPVRGSSEDGAVEETSLYRQKCQFSGWWTLLIYYAPYYNFIVLMLIMVSMIVTCNTLHEISVTECSHAWLITCQYLFLQWIKATSPHKGLYIIYVYSSLFWSMGVTFSFMEGDTTTIM